MPAPIVHLGASVMCMHGGTALPTAPFPRVLVSGQPVVNQACTYTIAGCSLASVPSPPCVTANWVVGALRVLAGGTPVILQTGQAICAASGQSLLVAATQPRVLAT
ncbi:MAG: hypothetical protein ACLFU2_06440 [Opitutales bacterium]